MASSKSDKGSRLKNVTGGRVVFSRTVQPADFESKRSEVELHFSVPEGAELGTILDDVSNAVRRKALELVGLKPKPGHDLPWSEDPPWEED